MIASNIRYLLMFFMLFFIYGCSMNEPRLQLKMDKSLSPESQLATMTPEVRLQVQYANAQKAYAQKNFLAAFLQLRFMKHFALKHNVEVPKELPLLERMSATMRMRQIHNELSDAYHRLDTTRTKELLSEILFLSSEGQIVIPKDTDALAKKIINGYIELIYRFDATDERERKIKI